VGPYLVYADYQALIDETLFKVEGVEGRTKRGLAIPIGRKRVAYRKMFMGFFYLGLFVVFGGSYNYSLSLTPWFAQLTLPRRYVMLLLSSSILY
jgi:lysophospholipid acyltransferase